MSPHNPQLYALTLGMVLVSLREKGQLRQAELAERLRVAQSSMSRFENGQSVPNALVLSGFAAALHTTSADLVALVDEGMRRVEKAMRQVIKLPQKDWWPAAIKQCGDQGARALIVFAVSTLLTERRPKAARALR